jgi:hypothetical protein
LYVGYAIAIVELSSTRLKRWRSVSYGYRLMAETVFSSIKRTFGEHVITSQAKGSAMSIKATSAQLLRDYE